MNDGCVFASHTQWATEYIVTSKVVRAGGVGGVPQRNKKKKK